MEILRFADFSGTKNLHIFFEKPLDLLFVNHFKIPARSCRWFTQRKSRNFLKKIWIFVDFSGAKNR